MTKLFFVILLGFFVAITCQADESTIDKIEEAVHLKHHQTLQEKIDKTMTHNRWLGLLGDFICLVGLVTILGYVIRQFGNVSKTIENSAAQAKERLTKG